MVYINKKFEYIAQYNTEVKNIDFLLNSKVINTDDCILLIRDAYADFLKALATIK